MVGRTLAWGTSLALVLSCGDRTELDGFLPSTPAVLGSPDGGANADPCPAAVAGPLPMAGNCSTRDGRSRVPSPSSPHVTWSTKLPVDSTGMAGPSYLATDNAGHAYVASEGEVDESVATIRRIDVATGATLWSQPFSPDEETSTPILLTGGGIDVFGYSMNSDAVFTYEPANGASTATTFGVSLYYAPNDLAVGTDGSLYVTHLDDVGEAHATTYISRVSPAGVVLWTTLDLGTLGPPLEYDDGEVFPSTIALAEGDLVVIMVNEITKTPNDAEVVTAFESATGMLRWSKTLAGTAIGGPVIGPDGNILALLSSSGGTSLVSLTPGTGATTMYPLATGVDTIYAVTRGGVVLAGIDNGTLGGLVAIDPHGNVLWTNATAAMATVASDGTIVSFGQTIQGLDPTTGTAKWTLEPPSTTPCTVSGALTSAGGIVGLECDGTLFGASD